MTIFLSYHIVLLGLTLMIKDPLTIILFHQNNHLIISIGDLALLALLGIYSKSTSRDLSIGPVVKILCLPMQEAGIPSLVREPDPEYYKN